MENKTFNEYQIRHSMDLKKDINAIYIFFYLSNASFETDTNQSSRDLVKSIY